MTLPHAALSGSQAGFGGLKPILILVVILSAMVVGYKVVPPYYEFHQMKTLANRVVGELKDLPRKEINQRVEYELHRINRNLPPEVFQVEERTEGYKVTIDFVAPMSFDIGGKNIPLGSYEEIEFHYEVGK